MRRLDRSYRRREQADEEYYYHQRGEYAEELDAIFTDRLCKKARRCGVPVPEIPGGIHQGDRFWQHGFTTGRWFLKEAGFAHVRREIEEAHKRRRDGIASWVGILTSLLMATVALLSVILSIILATNR